MEATCRERQVRSSPMRDPRRWNVIGANWARQYPARSDLRPAGRNLCERSSASRSTKLANVKRPTVIRRLSGSRPGAKCSTATNTLAGFCAYALSRHSSNCILTLSRSGARVEGRFNSVGRHKRRLRGGSFHKVRQLPRARAQVRVPDSMERSRGWARDRR